LAFNGLNISVVGAASGSPSLSVGLLLTATNPVGAGIMIGCATASAAIMVAASVDGKKNKK
jgi:hypothetical protein